MADTIGIHVNSLKKYEARQTQPSLDVLKKIALALHVSTDFLLFEEHERVPKKEFALKLETISQKPEEEQMVIREVLESLIISTSPGVGTAAERSAGKSQKPRLMLTNCSTLTSNSPLAAVGVLIIPMLRHTTMLTVRVVTVTFTH